MMVKRVIANSVSEAMELVKKDMGEDAIILNTRQIKVGGWLGLFAQKKVELVASIEEHPVQVPVSKKQVPIVPPVKLPVRNDRGTQPVIPKIVSFASRRMPDALRAYEALLAEPALQQRAEELYDMMVSTYYKTNDVTQVERVLLDTVESC